MAQEFIETQDIINRRLIEEGQPFNIPFATGNQTFGTGILSKSLSGGVIIYPGWVFIPKTINVGIKRAVEDGKSLSVYVNVGPGGTEGYSGYQLVNIGTVMASPDNMHHIGEGTAVNLLGERFESSDDTATPFFVRGGVNGTLMPKGYQTKCNYRIRHWGDSITQHSAFITSLSDDGLWTGLIREHYRTSGTPFPRTINKGKGGINSTNLVNALKGGSLYSSENINLTLCMIMTNDAIQFVQVNPSPTQGQIDTLVATFISNVTILVNNWLITRSPNEKLILIGATPLSNTTTEAILVQMRNALVTYVTGIGGAVFTGGSTPVTVPTNHIYVTSFGAATGFTALWTATDTSRYIETSGDRVHPNPASNALMGNFIVNMLTVNNIK